MALILDDGDLIELVIPTDDKPDPVLILKQPSDIEEDKFGRTVIKTIPRRHGKEETVVDYDLMKRFIDDHLVGCEDIDIKVNGERVSLDPEKHPDWKERIRSSWKYTAASHFMTGGDAARAREHEEKK